MWYCTSMPLPSPLWTDTRAPFDQCGSIWDASARNLAVIIHCLLLCVAQKIPPNSDCPSFLELFLPIIPSILTYQPHSYPFEFFKQAKILRGVLFSFSQKRAKSTTTVTVPGYSWYSSRYDSHTSLGEAEAILPPAWSAPLSCPNLLDTYHI